MPRSDGYKNLIPRKKGDKALPGAWGPKGSSLKTMCRKTSLKLMLNAMIHGRITGGVKLEACMSIVTTRIYGVITIV